MQVSVESLSNLERRMTVQVPAERIQEEVDRRLKSLVKRVRIDGFRPGKVPLKVVQKRYGEGVYQEVLGEILQSSYQEALAQESIIPAGTPDIEPQSMEAGQPLEYVATFEVFPEVQPADMSGAQIKRPQVEIAEADVDKVIESLRKQRREWVDVERPAAEGDQVVVDFKGTLDGEAFEGGEAEDVPIELGQGRMIKDFEDQLPGVTPGEEKTIEVNFPEDYPAEHLAGRTAEFALTVKKVQEASLPELNEEFAKAFGVEEGGIEKLREEVKSNMSREMGQAVKARVKDQVMDALLERNSVDLPSAIVQEEINRLREQTQARYGMNQEGAPQLPDEQFKADAERRVGLGLVIREIVRQHDIKVDQDKVTAELEAMAAGYEDPQQVISYYRSNKQAMSGLEAMVLEQQVVEWVLSQCEVSDEPMSFDALMNPSQENQA
ncbi:trigger factor [Ectothiorhodospira sp. BSL-9]|uniref:trigger factor n=1 Tax=Ectothiorhodospira sp. BSL-9 TaxID=1442136 RepID=UPI0007B442C5|nr:trigger factor [Ectothiorhodospira sp. BSL-9]ANB01155.1 trigger factor [Ectothiorhodospira sp. BSL-9]TVQ74736.1 MAG: trigger factor [Chromatiaceae bacterium]